jgi:hypothetical protein
MQRHNTNVKADLSNLIFKGSPFAADTAKPLPPGERWADQVASEVSDLLQPERHRTARELDTFIQHRLGLPARDRKLVASALRGLAKRATELAKQLN